MPSCSLAVYFGVMVRIGDLIVPLVSLGTSVPTFKRLVALDQCRLLTFSPFFEALRIGPLFLEARRH